MVNKILTPNDPEPNSFKILHGIIKHGLTMYSRLKNILKTPNLNFSPLASKGKDISSLSFGLRNNFDLWSKERFRAHRGSDYIYFLIQYSIE